MLDNGAYQIKASLASDERPQFHFNGMVREKSNKNSLVYGNKVIDEVESGKYNSRY